MTTAAEYVYEGSVILKFKQTSDRKMSDDELFEHLAELLKETSLTRDGISVSISPPDNDLWILTKKPDGLHMRSSERPPVTIKDPSTWAKR